jgi:hypothetical protein
VGETVTLAQETTPSAPETAAPATDRPPDKMLQQPAGTTDVSETEHKTVPTLHLQPSEIINDTLIIFLTNVIFLFLIFVKFPSNFIFLKYVRRKGRTC